MEDIYGEAGRPQTFAEKFAHALKTLWEVGTRETLTRYLHGTL